MPFESSTRFALVDCNNFFVSCERLFNPKLHGKAVVVLSNNQGCIVARSNEAKSLGIPMGAPFFEWEEKLARAQGVALAANFSLYSDLSKRVMSTIAHFHPRFEPYSIDEAFIDFSMVEDPLYHAVELRRVILAWTGIPVSIGVAPTRTLAKLAGASAKKREEGIFVLLSQKEIEHLLSETPVDAIWGIGHRTAHFLRRKGIVSALELRDQDLLWLKKMLSVVGVRIALELRGENSARFDEEPSLKKSIRTTRSFREPITDKEELFSEIASFVEKAAYKLRLEGEIAHFVRLFIATSPHNKTPFYSNEYLVRLASPTHFTPKLMEATRDAFEAIYRPHFSYKRAGVILEGLVLDQPRPLDLFALSKDKKENKLMEVVDEINERFSNTLHFGYGAYKEKSERTSSPPYTTSFCDLLTIRI